MEFYTENLGLLQFLLDKQYHHVVLLLQCEFFSLFSAGIILPPCTFLYIPRRREHSWAYAERF